MFGGCSSSRNASSGDDASALLPGQKPKWINSPQDYCGEQYWCAVGEGAGMMTAQTNARKNIALMLEASVKSNFQTTTTHQQTTQGGGISGSSQQETTAMIQEATEETLRGVTIKEQFVAQDTCYALASLDRRQAAKDLQEKIEEIDTKIESLYQTGKRSSFYQMLKLIPGRNVLAEKVLTLSGKTLALPVAWREIQNQQRIYEAQRPAVKIVIDHEEDWAGRDKKNLQHLLQKVLTENGYQLSSKRPTFQINVTADVRAEHLKVEGFIKRTWQISLKSERLADETSRGSLEAKAEATGRNDKDVWRQVENDLAEQIGQQFLDLNLD